jgi:hypothetical protein
MEEQGTLNLQVAGSSPARPKFYRHFLPPPRKSKTNHPLKYQRIPGGKVAAKGLILSEVLNRF